MERGKAQNAQNMRKTQASKCASNTNVTSDATEVSDLGKKGNELTQPGEVRGVAAKSFLCCRYSSAFNGTPVVSATYGITSKTGKGIFKKTMPCC